MLRTSAVDLQTVKLESCENVSRIWDNNVLTIMFTEVRDVETDASRLLLSTLCSYMVYVHVFHHTITSTSHYTLSTTIFKTDLSAISESSSTSPPNSWWADHVFHTPYVHKSVQNSLLQLTLKRYTSIAHRPGAKLNRTVRVRPSVAMISAFRHNSEDWSSYLLEQG